ncbi:MAG: amine dehydrogenase large subunit [Parvibaculum sp.]
MRANVFLGSLLALAGVLSFSASFSALADLPEENVGDVVPFDRSAHERLVWVSDMNSPYQAHSRAYLIDPDTGTFLSMLDLGYWTTGVQLPKGSGQIIAAETHFTRTTRGERQDFIVTYDGATFDARSEIPIPPKRASVVKMQGTAALTDDERFMAQINFTPANSVTLVDLQSGVFLSEEIIPGCANVFGGGVRQFHLLCGDGSFVTLTLGDAGEVVGKTRTASLFDPFVDPITISGVQKGSRWYFVSLAGMIHEFDMSADGVFAVATWPAFSDNEKSDEWSISGFQHLALHNATGRLYLLTHQGPEITFEDPGTHVFVYDVSTREKVDEIELAERSLSISISQDDAPLLYAIGAHIPMPFLAQIWVYMTQGEAAFYDVMQLGLDIYDADEGEYLRTVPKLGHFPSHIQPW